MSPFKTLNYMDVPFNHSLNECKAFRLKQMAERKRLIMNHGLCFRCCGPKKHRAKECTNNVRCDVCNGSHPAALHEDNRRHELEKSKGTTMHKNETRLEMVLSTSTQVFGTIQGTSKSCAKMVLARIYDSLKQHSRTVYVLIDD